MNSSKKSIGILTRQIVPAFAALSLFATSAQADSNGATKIANELTAIPGIKLGTTAANAKPNDLLYAMSVALDSATTTSEIAGIVEAALETVAGKARKDKDKIAGQVIATAIANNNITDPAVIAEITKRVFNVNSTLSATGKGVALAGALKASSPTASAAIGAALGGSGTGEFGGAPAEVATLLANTAKALSTSAPKAALSLEAFVQGFLTDELASDTDRKAQAEAAATLVASKVPAGAGGILGGYVGTLTGQDNGSLATLAGNYVTNTKLAKALGEILAHTMDGHTDQSALFGTLPTTEKNKALVAQGLIRSVTAPDQVLTTSETTDIVKALITGGADRVKSAGVVAAGNGNDEGKVESIVRELATGADPVKQKPAIGAAVISAIGVLNPETADTAIKTLIGGSVDATANNALGAAIAPKVKAYAAVGYMAAGIAEKNIGSATGTAAEGIAVTTANAIMSKASKAATDVVYRTAELSAIASKADFAKSIALANSKFALNAAVGASLASQADAGAITAAVIKTGAKTTLAKAPVIAGAVASAVDEERAAEVLFSVGGLVSETGTVAGKPLKASAFKLLAKSLAVAIQKKPNVTTLNRADELGEIAALLTDAVVSAYGTLADTDTKKIAARNKAITAVGVEVLKALSKKPVGEAKALLADKSSSADIAGSIALTIRNAAGVTTAQETALLAAGGSLEKALAKLAGKTGTTDFAGVTTAIADVRSGAAAALAGYEDGTLRNGAALSDLFNDKETDKRNR